ncbi:MAG: GTP-binding protein [Synechococcales bacterium]|nr:GTP-binding protein [Synechococcales bacterium]
MEQLPLSEDQEEMDGQSSRKTEDNVVPVTVLTSYLGAGKTTLLNRILTHARAVFIPDQVIDHEIVIVEYCEAVPVVVKLIPFLQG